MKKTCALNVRLTVLAASLALASGALYGQSTQKSNDLLSDLPIASQAEGGGGGIFIIADDSIEMGRYYMPEFSPDAIEEYTNPSSTDLTGYARAYRDFYFTGNTLPKLWDYTVNTLSYDEHVTYAPPAGMPDIPSTKTEWEWNSTQFGMPGRIGTSNVKYRTYTNTMDMRFPEQRVIPGPAMGRSVTRELSNYANWATYYRNRLAANKAAMSHALEAVSSGGGASSISVGFGTISAILHTDINSSAQQMAASMNQKINLQPVLAPAGFSGTHKTAVLNALHNYSMRRSSQILKAMRTVLDEPSFAVGGSSANNICGGAGGIVYLGDAIYKDEGYDSLQSVVNDHKGVPISVFAFGAEDKNGKVDNGKLEADYGKRLTDMKNASIASGGVFVGAHDPAKFVEALKGVVGGGGQTVNLAGTQAGSAISGIDLFVTTKQYVYTPSFTGDWAGDIKKGEIGQNGKVKETSVSAAEKLDKVVHSNRNIFTKDNIAFTDSVLSSRMATEYANLGRGDGVNYLRGDRSKEGAGGFRKRSHVLGDIVNAAPVVVAAPYCLSDSAGEIVNCSITEEDYVDFYTKNKNRGMMVYAAANDGMLHAFDADLNEKWAYVPSDLMRPKGEKGLANLADPDYPHYFYVDATPRSYDVKFPNGEWHTMLVGGLGKGGKMYYGIDVTEGASASNPKVWEYRNDDLGYTYGRPIITTTKALKNDDDSPKWVAIVPSGYTLDKGNGKACLYFIDIENGDPIKINGETGLCTSEGSTSRPLNMAAISSYIADESSQLTLTVYGGDSQGNLWRFDISSDDTSQWTVNKLGVLKDAAGKNQYVTTEPYPFLVDDKRYVAVGTGGFRSDNDLQSATINSMYVFRDGDSEQIGTNTDIARASMFAQNATTAGKETLSAENKTKLDEYGWFMDLPAGYHINVNPQAMGRNLIIAANQYIYYGRTDLGKEELCTDGSKFRGLLYVRDAGSGESRLTNDSGSVLPNLPVDKGIAGINFVVIPKDDGKGNKVPQAEIVISTNEGKTEYANMETDPSGSNSTEGLPQQVNIRYLPANE